MQKQQSAAGSNQEAGKSVAKSASSTATPTSTNSGTSRYLNIVI
jgi:hypothetical protein